MSWFAEALRCPQTGAKLEKLGDELVCEAGTSPRYAYPFIDGVPILLAEQAREVKE